MHRPPKCCDPKAVVRKGAELVERCKSLSMTDHICNRRWADGRGPMNPCPSRCMVAKGGRK